MKQVKIIVLLFATLLVGCASNPMTVLKGQMPDKAGENEAQVVFMRSSFVGNAINASLYEVIDGELKFIGIIPNDTKIAYKTTAGKHLFMVVSEAADFMEADLVNGKTYYSMVTPRMGFWVARFSLWPFRGDGTTEFNTATQDFKSWLQKTVLVENSEKSLQWFDKKRASVTSKFTEYLPVWKTKTAGDLAQRTLNPDDGQ